MADTPVVPPDSRWREQYDLFFEALEAVLREADADGIDPVQAACAIAAQLRLPLRVWHARGVARVDVCLDPRPRRRVWRWVLPRRWGALGHHYVTVDRGYVQHYLDSPFGLGRPMVHQYTTR